MESSEQLNFISLYLVIPHHVWDQKHKNEHTQQHLCTPSFIHSCVMACIRVFRHVTVWLSVSIITLGFTLLHAILQMHQSFFLLSKIWVISRFLQTVLL